MKKKRIENRALIEFIKANSPCIACGGPGPVDAHHVTSRGAGGGDEVENLMALHRLEHQEFHKIGWSKFCEKYPSVRYWLELANRDDILRRLKLPDSVLESAQGEESIAKPHNAV